MNLVIDIGNTRIKSALFKEFEVFNELVIEGDYTELFRQIEEHNSFISKCIISSVKTIPEELTKGLAAMNIDPLILNHKTPLPFVNKYESKDTLGLDRIAGIAGACMLYPGKDTLVVDAGTALTIDLKTSAEEYLGGNISPGLSMRFRALNEYTEKLPLFKSTPSYFILGTSTKSAIVNGVQNGLVFEINSYIDTLRNKYPELLVLLTGGDCHFFDNKLKKPIFVHANLTLLGLNFILQNNAKNN